MCLGWQGNLLLAHLAFPDALVPGYKALSGCGSSSVGDVDDGLSIPVVFQRSERPTPHIKTIFKRKKRQVIVVGGSLLRGTEGPLCWISPLLCRISCLSWVWVKDQETFLPGTALGLLAVGALLCGNEAIKHSLKASKRDLIQNIETDPSCSFSCDCKNLISISKSTFAALNY